MDKVVDVPGEVPQFKFSLVGVVDVPVVQIVGLCAPVVEQIVVCQCHRSWRFCVGKLAVEQIVVCQATDHGGFRGVLGPVVDTPVVALRQGGCGQKTVEVPQLLSDMQVVPVLGQGC